MYLMVSMFKRMKIWNKGKSVVIVIMMKLRLANGTRIKVGTEMVKMGRMKEGDDQSEILLDGRR